MITSILTLAGGVVVMAGCGVVGAATLKFLNTFELNVPTKLKSKNTPDRKAPGRNYNNKIDQGRSRIGGNNHRPTPSSFGEDY